VHDELAKSAADLPSVKYTSRLARQPDVQSPILTERRPGVASVTRSFWLATAGGLPFVALDGLEEFLLIRIKLDEREEASAAIHAET
jgi:hypothetical protein